MVTPSKSKVVPSSGIPVVVGVNREHIPDGITSMHKCAVSGMADSYNDLKTGGVVARIDVLNVEIQQYPELTGIETIWLMYRAPRESVVL